MSDRTRRTQAERTAATRARLIEAAYDCLLETGYAATTVGAVQERAGVARGTLLHHFPTRASLMVGVVEDIADRRLAVLASPEAAEPAGQDWDAVVDLLWRDLQSPAFLAALELWVAARTDPPLREALVPVQDRLFAAIHRAVTALVGDDPRAPTLVQFTIDLLTGTTMAGMLGPGREQAAVVVARWKDALVVLAGQPGR
ncbi:MAG TPA: TetR/AcrR family transcriptional regulator [Nocardioides sp.]|uniref:TetR/AcrR family transcriptional regulator n=1 Tax=Nocardioides sp. TaxID=35761 RepID=UPI002C1CF35A|nr:TetR/AcrR family transcriptional regulator [Nocardioides sp.]HTW17400.1 TetR/AcrR family transcriptional regulator [Nocardioides sp.]